VSLALPRSGRPALRWTASWPRGLDRRRKDVATCRGRVRWPGAGRFPASPLSRPARCRSGGPSAGFPGLGRDGQRNWQTVYRGSRTCGRSSSSANVYSFSSTCRQRSPLSVADALDTARINLPVDSQTDISAKLLKQSSVAGRGCVTYVNSWPPVRGPVSVRYQVLAPWSVPARCQPGVRPGEGSRGRRREGSERRRGKGGRGGGKKREGGQ
jgi:hypothetical protein